jgi:Lar family restriction alleviation protein
MTDNDNRSSAATTAPLLPCPFCGGEAGYFASQEAVFRASWIGHVYHCTKCQARVQSTDRERALSIWNTRSDGAAQPTRMAGGDWAQLLTLRDVMKTAYKRGGDRLMSVWERDLNAIEAAIMILDKAAQPPAAPVEILNSTLQHLADLGERALLYANSTPAVPVDPVVATIKRAPELLDAAEAALVARSSAGTSDAVKAAQAVELANKIDLHLTLSGSSPGFHLSEDELQMAAAALRYAAMPREPQEAVKREVAKVYVVAQNDFPAAVFDSQEGAEQFVSRQPTKTISKTPIYWRVHMFTLDTLAVTRPHQRGGE